METGRFDKVTGCAAQSPRMPPDTAG